MKRKTFIRHLGEHGCELLREGGKYSVYKNPANGAEVPVTRHPEIADYTVKKLCKELWIDSPK
ncbi:MAG: type II toxin-antitoxin system HicA family toxin [Elusimicrobiaceae bacterium]|nr:type II toxin-antitoxin system HicA family toxin [Elusimicrobiaceae bacterium]